MSEILETYKDGVPVHIQFDSRDLIMLSFGLILVIVAAQFTGHYIRSIIE